MKTSRTEGEPKAEEEHEPFKTASDVSIFLQSVLSELEMGDLKCGQMHFDNKPELTVRHNTSCCGGTQNRVAIATRNDFHGGEFLFFFAKNQGSQSKNVCKM